MVMWISFLGANKAEPMTGKCSGPVELSK
jgi:hypothetical protein